MLLTIISIINFLLGWIPVVIFHYTGFEKLTWSDIPWEPLMITDFCNMLNACFVVIGVAVTYPVFISLGSLFGIPINAVIDAIFRNESFSALKIVSTLLLAVGFLILLIPLEKAKSISRTPIKIAASTTSLTFPIHALVLMIFKGETLRQIYKESIKIYPRKDLKKIFWLRFLPLAILTNLIVAFTYYPLNFTAPTNITAIFSSVLSMVYILSVLFLKEPFVLLRALAVCLSTTGVVLFAFDDGFGSFATLGVILSVFFTLTAACFRVYEKYSIGDASPIQASMLLTIISIINFLLGWIPVVIFHYTGFEKLTWSDIPWEPLMITNLFNMLHSCFVVIGVAVTYPVFISLGSLFGIPINAVIDAIFRNESFSALKIAWKSIRVTITLAKSGLLTIALSNSNEITS
ncbi:putative thiamine transporter SLC35F3 [Trichoplax sp. H2]|nr:putative thiamine transporter SLC35F3 [Trichoplax sp. H2]|eukprot:RDD36704.1 putative thiamine transporter SLC35F3 [Trichoplax sp. H2]